MAVATDPQQKMAQALAAINTPEHAGLAVIQSVLAAAAKQQRKNGTQGPIEIPLTATVAIGDPFGPGDGEGEDGGCFTVHLNGVTVTFCHDL
ncbi:hypothetical protein [Streptomyces sp. IBSBF 2806]|uniref:hypothetical protein n=1 Tax=Streptomyces sp. IBSBF 2806 TaxID=2903529 RepID=UPI002FDBCC89